MSTALQKVLKKAEKFSAADLVSGKKGWPKELGEIADLLLEDAAKAAATTVHFEPRTDGVHVRYRIDGLLHDAYLLPKSSLPAIAGALGIAVSFPTAYQPALTQFASAKLTISQKPYTVRFSTLPTIEGEKLVADLIPQPAKTPTLQQLGYWGPNMQVVGAAMAKAQGLIVLSGPHDAGVNEGMYSMLGHLANPAISIATLEESITYHVPGVSQTQINPRAQVTFAAGLQALLRQDPNIIALSNLHESETASLVVKAALSGRLVVAGMYASRAVAVISQLLAMGIEPYLLAHTVQAVVNQRQLRKLCDACKQTYSPSEQEMIGFLKTLGIKTAAQLEAVRQLERQAIDEKLAPGAQGNTSLTHLYKPAEKGCEHCSHTGYKGMLGIFEVLPFSETTTKLILGTADALTIQQQALQEGMPSLYMDGLVKVLLGLTSIDELMHAADTSGN